MLVRNWMSRKVITADVKDSMQDAINSLKEYDIPMLPVMKKGKLVGIITDRDLKRASPSDATTLEMHELLFLVPRLKVGKIMTKDPITVPPDFTVEEAAELFLRKGISGAPVADHNGQVVGTITRNDLFRVLISLTGLGKRGIQFALKVEDTPGSIKEITDIIRGYGGRMVSILSAYEGTPSGFRKVFIRMLGIDREKLSRLKKDIREKATLLYMVDHRENTREIFQGRSAEI